MFIYEKFETVLKRRKKNIIIPYNKIILPARGTFQCIFLHMVGTIL